MTEGRPLDPQHPLSLYSVFEGKRGVGAATCDTTIVDQCRRDLLQN